MFIFDFFRPILSDRKGTMLASAALDIGTGGRLVTASATTSFVAPLPRQKVALKSITLPASVAAAGSGAITVTVNKVSTANGVQALTSATSLTSSVVTAEGTFALAFSSGLADGKRLIDGLAGDYVRIDLIAAGTVTTQPIAAVVLEYGFCQ
jgi:hypothetical protein